MKFLDLRHVVYIATLTLAGCASHEAEYKCGEVKLTINEESLQSTILLENSAELELPLKRQGGVLIYAKMRPGIDDERVVTERMLRFDPGGKHLIYLENLDGVPFLVERQCSRR